LSYPSPEDLREIGDWVRALAHPDFIFHKEMNLDANRWEIVAEHKNRKKFTALYLYLNDIHYARDVMQKYLTRLLHAVERCETV